MTDWQSGACSILPAHCATRFIPEMILTDSCERHQSRLGELFGRLAVVSVIACVLHGNFDANFIQCLCRDSRRKFISQSVAVKPDFASGYNSRAWSLHMKGEDAKGLVDIAVLVVAAVAGIAMASALLRRLVR